MSSLYYIDQRTDMSISVFHREAVTGCGHGIGEAGRFYQKLAVFA
jgi:hypothetical protein